MASTESRGSLDPYQEKRDFRRTAEPTGDNRSRASDDHHFVVQKHAASRLHYDLRLQWKGSLKSWAVTKGPSLDPSKKRLAVRTEDHPLGYEEFEGAIPKDEYGGGTVMIWDRGTFEPLHDPDEGLDAGKLHFRLHGDRMQGGWTLVRLENEDEKWLLIKERDDHADDRNDLLRRHTTSVATGRSMKEIARDDRPADEPVERAGVRLSSPGKLMFSSQGLSKHDLARYYECVADRMLRRIADRPLSFVRCPQGQGRKCFFEKHDDDSFPEAISSVEIKEKSGRKANYFFVRDTGGLIAAVQMGVLEFHVWSARRDRLERPDRLVFDLDPDEGMGFDHVREAAFLVRDRLDGLGLASVPLVTGGKGVHVIAPLERRAGWDKLKRFAKGLAQKIAHEQPDAFTATMSRAKRKNRIFIDWLRNERGSTAIAPYSTRAREGAPVATPVSWEELRSLDRANGFDPSMVIDRLEDADPWGDIEKTRQSITKRALEAVEAAR